MKIHIGSTDYTLTFEKDLGEKHPEFNKTDDDSLKCYGLCSEVHSSIHVEKDIEPQFKKKVLMHEITHGLLGEISEQLTYDEDFVDALSKQLYALVVRNDIKKLLAMCE